MNGLDLFSGIGGITKALEGYVEPKAYCENDRYAQAVLLSRMATGDLPLAPIWDDIKTLTSREIPPVEIIYGGFPCQDISLAGYGKGLAGQHSGLFFQLMRLVREIRPRFVFLENVSAITLHGALGVVVGELSSIGYDCRWETLCASEVGSQMHGHRWFLLSKTIGSRLEGLEQWKFTRQKISMHSSHISPKIQEEDVSANPREVDGIHIPVDRIRALGNAVVPAQAREAFERLMGLK